MVDIITARQNIGQLTNNSEVRIPPMRRAFDWSRHAQGEHFCNLEYWTVYCKCHRRKDKREIIIQTAHFEHFALFLSKIHELNFSNLFWYNSRTICALRHICRTAGIRYAFAKLVKFYKYICNDDQREL